MQHHCQARQPRPPGEHVVLAEVVDTIESPRRRLPGAVHMAGLATATARRLGPARPDSASSKAPKPPIDHPTTAAGNATPTLPATIGMNSLTSIALASDPSARGCQ